MQAILNGEHLFEYEGLPVMGEIVLQVIERDHLYLVRLGKRPRALHHWPHHLLQYTPLYRAAKDAYLSHLCHLAVLSKHIGSLPSALWCC